MGISFSVTTLIYGRLESNDTSAIILLSFLSLLLLISSILIRERVRMMKSLGHVRLESSSLGDKIKGVSLFFIGFVLITFGFVHGRTHPSDLGTILFFVNWGAFMIILTMFYFALKYHRVSGAEKHKGSPIKGPPVKSAQ